MESKLTLNLELVTKARASASKVADDVQQFIPLSLSSGPFAACSASTA